MKRLGTFVAIGVVLIIIEWKIIHPSANHQAVSANGPLRLVIRESIVGTNQLTASQLAGLSQWVSKTSSPAPSELAYLRIVQITNTSRQPLELVGYNSASPSYDFYIDGAKGLERLTLEIPSNRPLMKFNLGPTQGISFPIIPPQTDRPRHVSLSYNDYTAPATAIPKAPARLEKIVGRIREFVPFLRKSPVQFYWTMSQSITNEERTTYFRTGPAERN
jgi:hypothetical protein